MAFVRSETGSRNAASSGWASPRSGRLARFTAVSCAGTLLALSSLAALGCLVFLATSLISPAGLAPQAQRVAAFYPPAVRQPCRSDCRQRTQYIVQQAKRPRSTDVADKHLDPAWLAREAARQRFEQARAALTHEKLASAIARARDTAIALNTPSKDRLYPAAGHARLADRHDPIASRFGAKIPEIERSSRLALALAGSGTLHVSYPVHTASLAPAMPLSASPAGDSSTDIAVAPAFDPAPESAPLPARRPKLDTAKPAAIAEAPSPRKPATLAAAAPRRAAKPSPTRRGGEQQALAYAAPDDGAGSVGQAFKNLFSSPGAGNGVAVYDISAQTVTMPDGSVLEAHSGIGHMADDPRYVSQKMNGPTPPNTYKLVMRESRFYGVEAIRMLPAEPGKMHGRNGILAHSYLLRGRTAQSHGCVAFADYDRFLKAFKQGKVKHMVVVPGRGKAAARVARNGRGV